MKKLITIVLALAMILSLAACETQPAAPAAPAEAGAPAEAKTEFRIGICNYVDHPSLNQIVANVQERLDEIAAAQGVTFKVDLQNCNADAAVLNQIIANFIADGVDLMVGVATPVAMTMQAATEDNGIPVVFAAVSDPVSCGLVEDPEAPEANITGTSDALDTASIMRLIFAADPDAKKVGLLYDVGQDASTTAIAEAKAFLEEKGVEIVERTGVNTAEVQLAAEALVADGVDAIFTPTDNTIMAAELSIYELFTAAKIPHYTGADSFALNGAFLGYGVDYANLGRETADMVAEILVGGKAPSELPVRTFDNGTATVNTETCDAIGFDFDAISEAFAPYCTAIDTEGSVWESFRASSRRPASWA